MKVINQYILGFHESKIKKGVYLTKYKPCEIITKENSVILDILSHEHHILLYILEDTNEKPKIITFHSFSNDYAFYDPVKIEDDKFYKLQYVKTVIVNPRGVLHIFREKIDNDFDSIVTCEVLGRN